MKKWMTLLLALMLIMSMQAVSLADAYTATAKGFGGDVTVTLTIDNGALTAVEAEGKNETEGIGTRALEYLPGVMLESNSVDVEAVSGATFTSNAIKEAAAAALAASGAELAAVEAEMGAMIPGVYTGSARGFHDMITVEVEVTENAIVRVAVKEHNDTVNVGTLAFPVLEESIVANQSLADVVSGVTFTSNGINGAVVEALKAAGASAGMINKFMTAEIPVAQNPGDTETDVVVVGAGIAGMAAAMNAQEQGAEVILLEKEEITGGSARLSASCIWATDFELSNKEYDFTAEEIYEFINAKSGPVYNKDVFFAVTNNTGRALTWLYKDNMDALFTMPSNPKEIPQVTAVINGGMGPAFITLVDEMLSNHNIDVRFGSPAVELVMNEDGSVGGVVVENESGRYTIKAKKVILATGGYTYNEEMMKEYGAGKDRNNRDWTAIGATGDGHKMGLAVGGYLLGEGTLNLGGVANRPDGFSFRIGSPILMDKNGLQMAAMDEHYSTVCDKITSSEEGVAYVVYDSADPNALVYLEQLVAEGDAVKADTLEELAVKMGITSVENFMATIENHNKHYHEKTDDEWGTAASALTPIEQGPFYGFGHASYVMGTIAGLAVNTNMQVVKEDGAAVENLYAIGELMFGNMFNTLYPMSGTAITTCISGGQIASDHAVATMAK